MSTKVLLATVAGLLLWAGTLQAQVVIVNPAVKVADISAPDLRDIFLGASTSFKNGAPAVPVTATKAPVHGVFLKDCLGVSQVQFNAAWRKLLFAGQGVIPRSFDAEVALLDFIAATPGAIGYVSAAPARKDVKVLAIK